MEIIDSHAHIYVNAFEKDLAEVLDKAKEEGVGDIYMPNIDISTIDAMHMTEENHPQCKSMMGIHPCHIKQDYKEQLAEIEKWLGQRNYAAVGEIGIDLYWDKSFAEEQFESFEYQIQLAHDHDLGIVIHSRQALDHTIEMVSRLQNGNLRGIFHCFNGTVDQGKAIVDIGFYLGIGGVVTYKNAGVDKSVSQLPLEWMVLETDAPYLSPGPKRSKRNEPAKLPLIINKLEEILEESRDEIIRVTSLNCQKVFSY